MIDNGFYKVSIERGTYELWVSTSQYHSWTEEGVVFKENTDSHKDITMDPFDTGIKGHIYDENGDPGR